MPALPWKQFIEPEPESTYTVMCSRLPLKRHRSIPGFLRDTIAIRRQLAKTPGLVGYALDAKVLAKTFWTLSAWTGNDDLSVFNLADPHHTITGRLRPQMDQAEFVFFTALGSELPPDWSDARRRLQQSP